MRALTLVSLVAIVFVFFLFALSVGTAYAQCPSGTTGAGGFVPLECFSPSSKLTGAYNEGELGPFLQKLFVGAISLGAMLAVLRLAWAGFVYMGTEMWGKKEHAREVITDTLLGLFLLLSIWLILHQINPDILKLKVEVPTPATTPSATPGGQPINTQFGPLD